MQSNARRRIGPRIMLLCWLLVMGSASAGQAVVGGQFNFEPPRIVVAEEPTRLMLIDGPPVRIPVEGTQLEFVVNTDWTVFHDRTSRSWFVIDEGHWLRNNMLSSGQWLTTTDLPDDFLTLQLNSDWPEVDAAMPPRLPAAPPLPVLISYEPTELILLDGPMAFEPVADTGLRFVSNTERDLFELDGRYYLLLAGRWFSTKDVKRMWYPVHELPQQFAMIPPDHPRGRVLAAVPGTPQAAAAAKQAAQPRTRLAEADAGDGLTVPWVGEPQFVQIEGTPLRRGRNTPYQVILHNNYYYLCHEGAWYRSSSANGPWVTAREIAEAIYTIPATDPAYNVTFVRVDSFDDSTGRVAYSSTSGYHGVYWTGSTLVYGTGWYHPGYYSRSAYWHYPYAYGYWGGPSDYWGPYGSPQGYVRSETYELNPRENDWEWELDGSKRRVYRYGPRNVVGGEYIMPESTNYKGTGRQRPEPRN